MRITALSSVLAIGVVGALTLTTRSTPAHADRKKPMATRELAALVDPARAPRAGASLSTGELGLTAARAPAPTPDAADGTLLAVAPALRERPEGSGQTAGTLGLMTRGRSGQTAGTLGLMTRGRHLTTSDVATVVGDRAADIERCYVDAIGAARRGGKLDVMFTIARNGSVLSVDTAAPGLSTVAAHRMHTCIRTAVEGLAFPARRNDTTAIVPYYFQRTDAPNAGPQLSCWNPRGC